MRYDVTNVLALVVALSLSTVAAYYSIIGLTAIFAASFWPVVIMGSTLEFAKVVTTSWLYRNWNIAPRFVKYYLTLAVVILMLITSIGIFGYLSKAHIEQSSKTTTMSISVEAIESKIAMAKDEISSAKTTLQSLDTVVKTLTDAQRIRGQDGAVAVRSNQEPERTALKQIIDSNTKQVASLLEEKMKLDSDISALSAEVGPIKYVAELLYGKSDQDTIEHAVRIVILTLIFVFDPLAVLLLIGANAGLERKDQQKFTTVTELQKKTPRSSGHKNRSAFEKPVVDVTKMKPKKEIGPTLPI